MEWILLIVLAVAAAGAWMFTSARRRARALPARAGGADWRPAIEAAARSLGGRPALAGADAELRAEHEGLTVTVKVRGTDVSAEASLHAGAKPLRIYLGAGGAAPPSDFAHVPEAELPPAFALEPPVVLRSDDAPRAVAFAEAGAMDLVRVQREAGARSVDVLARGGSIRVGVYGARPAPEAIEALVQTATRLAGRLGGDEALPRGAASTKQLPAKIPAVESCALCGGARRPGVEWVVCARCGSPHHAECWNTATGCSKAGCGGVTTAAR
jgi:hypothetical protein